MGKEWCPKCKVGMFGRYCTTCGEKLVDRPRCKCGGELYAHGKFCQNCGKEVPHA